jgi:predicted DNA-binding transcriptional regulator YafY
VNAVSSKETTKNTLKGNDMERTTRLFELHRLLLNCRHPLSLATIQNTLECSRATAQRVLNALRDLTRDPITYDREGKGYRYQNPAAHAKDLPFIWFSAAEFSALLVIDQHLETIHTSLLGEALAPLREKVQSLLDLQGESSGEARRRIRVQPLAQRDHASCFPRCAEALLQRKRLRISYEGRGDGELTEREISPQRLAHYRDNWYVQAWCHKRQEPRCFAVERIRQAEILPSSAEEIASQALDEYFGASYGIFSGPAQAIAILSFSPGRARWVAEEQWHPKQQGRFLEDGRYELSIPYGDPTELIMDILRQGPEAEVLAPAELRQAVIQRLQQALDKYRG